MSSSIKILNAVSADLQQTGLERWQQDRILKNFVLQFPEFSELTSSTKPAIQSYRARLERPEPASPARTA